MKRMPIEFEELDEEQVRSLQNYLRTCVEELESERDWRDAEDPDLLPVVRGLIAYLSREYLNEDAADALDSYEMEDFDDEEELEELEF